MTATIEAIVTSIRSRPGLVLIHGAFHTAACWAPTVVELERQTPRSSVLAVDLPGRGARPGDLRTVTPEDCVDSVVEQIDRAGLDEVVVVARSSRVVPRAREPRRPRRCPASGS